MSASITAGRMVAGLAPGEVRTLARLAHDAGLRLRDAERGAAELVRAGQILVIERRGRRPWLLMRNLPSATDEGLAP